MAQAAGTTDSAIKQGSSALNNLVDQSDGQPQLNEEVVKALETYKKKDTAKGEILCHFSGESNLNLQILCYTVVVRFKGVGNAPVMKQNMYKITATNRFQAVIQFLRKELGWQNGEPLVCDFMQISRLLLTL